MLVDLGGLCWLYIGWLTWLFDVAIVDLIYVYFGLCCLLLTCLLWCLS